MYRLVPAKRIEGNTSVSFLRQTIRRALVVLRPVIHWLCELLNYGLSRSMVTLESIEFGCVHKLYPLNRIVRTIPAVRQLVTETGLIACQYTLSEDR